VALAGVRGLAQRWQGRWPGSAAPGAGACLGVVAGRDILLQSLAGEAAARNAPLPHEVRPM
jgi:hypothetical protein